ncbi:DMT family transporter [Rhodobacteraceae bacterium NNCM2]|nr:DMT family transporter [Coraliihabitans acroporae]
MQTSVKSGAEMSDRAWIELLLLSLLWGGSFFSIAIAQRELGPITVVFHRVFWAALLLWLIIGFRGLSVPRDLGTWGAFLVMGCLNNVIPFTLMSWGQTHIETGLVSIFNATTAIFGVVVAAIVLRDEPLSLRRLVGVICGFAGVAVISGFDEILSLDLRALGQLAVLGGALSYAFASVWAKLTLRGQPPMVAAAGMLTASSLVMLPFAWITEGRPSLDLRLDTWLAIGYFSAFATTIAYLLYYRILAMAGAGNLMLCTLMIPPVAILLGSMFLDEELTPQVYAGFALIAIGLMVSDGRLLRGVRPSI